MDVADDTIMTLNSDDFCFVIPHNFRAFIGKRELYPPIAYNYCAERIYEAVNLDVRNYYSMMAVTIMDDRDPYLD